MYVNDNVFVDDDYDDAGSIFLSINQYFNLFPLNNVFIMLFLKFVYYSNIGWLCRRIILSVKPEQNLFIFAEYIKKIIFTVYTN